MEEVSVFMNGDVEKGKIKKKKERKNSSFWDLFRLPFGAQALLHGD